GGITTLDQARDFLAEGLDGAMIGRAAYHEPWNVLGRVDEVIFGDQTGPDAFEVVERMRPYIARHIAAGGRLHQITRHMLGLFRGRAGARGWRRILSERGHGDDAGLPVLDAALAEVARLAA